MKPVWMTMIVFFPSALSGAGGHSYHPSEQLKGLPSLLTQISASRIARAGAARLQRSF